MPAFTRDQLMDLWRSVMDPGYTQPLLAGGGTGVELVEQAAEQFARASTMVNRNGQAMFIMPNSGQTDEPAGGARRATVALVFERSGIALQEATFYAGQVLVEVATTDFGPDGPVEVLPGRRYVVGSTTCFVPGSLRVTATATAEKPGYGYNLPLSGTIVRFVQPGSTLANDRAQVVPGATGHQLVLRPAADVLGVQSIGQYVELQGTNAGAIRRVVDYVPPTDSTTGGTAVLAATGVLAVDATAGFIVGEAVEQASTGATGTLIAASAGYVVYDRTSLADFAVGAIDGIASGAGANVTAIEQAAGLLADTSASWAVLGWDTDFAMTVTNEASPEGGRSAMLDELGHDRDVNRSPGETDDQYRVRVWKLPDVVSPNAVKRAANRVLAAHGAAACFREVGAVDALFPGFFYDVSPADVGADAKYAYAYDLDFDVRPQDRFKLVMDYVEFRAFFEIGVPPAALGEFGYFYDVLGEINFYDSSPYLTFFDGFPMVSADMNRRVWEAVNKAKAGGVGFDLYEERLGCF